MILIKEKEKDYLTLYDLHDGSVNKYLVNGDNLLFSQHDSRVIACGYCTGNSNTPKGHSNIYSFNFNDKSIKTILKIDGLKATKILFDGTMSVIVGVDNGLLIVNSANGKFTKVHNKSHINLNGCVLVDNVFYYSTINSKYLYMYDINNKRKTRLLGMDETIIALLLFDNYLIIWCGNLIKKVVDIFTHQTIEDNNILVFIDSIVPSTLQQQIHDDCSDANSIFVLDNVIERIVSKDEHKVIWELGEGYLIMEERPQSWKELVIIEALVFKQLSLSEEERERYGLTYSSSKQ